MTSTKDTSGTFGAPHYLSETILVLVDGERDRLPASIGDERSESRGT